MSVHRLDYLFKPRSVAVVGASNRPGKVGNVVMRNLQLGGFQGPIMPVHPRYDSVAGVLAYPDVESLPVVPDLVVLCTPARTIPDLMESIGQKGARAAVVLTAGMDEVREGETDSLRSRMLSVARRYGTRLLGPNCLGLLSSEVKLNASFAHLPAKPGSIGFVSQSGALCTAVLDWASEKGIGFSHFVSVGDMTDIDFGDVLDYLAADPATRSILLYIESIRDARKFLSAARAAARNKTVLAIKSGRAPEGAAAAASHTGALAGSDDVYDAAIRRAGVLRVFAIDELFSAVETLGRARRPREDALTILTNGGGPGVLAADSLVLRGGRLADLDDGLIEKLDGVLPSTWSGANPIDIIGDAAPERYRASLDAILEDGAKSSVLVLHVPTALCSSTEAAATVAEAAAAQKRLVQTCWLGGDTVAEARAIFSGAGVPTYDTPEDAVTAFLQLVDYRRNQDMLMETPVSIPEVPVDAERARAIARAALEAGRDLLTEVEAKEVLAAYGIPVVETRTAEDPDAAADVATSIGFPVALKIHSTDITHKSDVGGVVLDLEDAEAVREAATAMLGRVTRIAPDAAVQGFSVQEMARRPGAYELILGVTTDEVFGPVIAFGEGGTAVEVVRDRALALPPLNAHLARELVTRTRVYERLKGFRHLPAVDLPALDRTLVQLSQLVTDVSEIHELDVNPLWCDERGVLALDARIVVRADGAGPDRLAIRPYPKELEETWTLASGTELLLRPIRPEDEKAHFEMFENFTQEDIRFRFFGLVRSFAHSEMARYTQIDYDREMAFIATTGDEPAKTLGVVRAVSRADASFAEFALIVRSDVKGQGLGKALLQKMIRYCRERGVRELRGDVLEHNRRMLGLAESLGFSRGSVEGGSIHITLDLTDGDASDRSTS